MAYLSRQIRRARAQITMTGTMTMRDRDALHRRVCQHEGHQPAQPPSASVLWTIGLQVVFLNKLHIKQASRVFVVLVTFRSHRGVLFAQARHIQRPAVAKSEGQHAGHDHVASASARADTFEIRAQWRGKVVRARQQRVDEWECRHLQARLHPSQAQAQVQRRPVA